MSGVDKQAEQQQKQLAAQQMQILQDQTAQSQQRTAAMDALQKPLIDYSKAAITNPLQLMKGTMGGLFDIDKQVQTGKQSIMDSVPEGAARDAAMAQLSATAPQMRGQALNQNYMQGLTTLAGIGDQTGAFGLQQLGAGMRAGEGASQTNNAMMQAAAQRKAATMGAIGQAAGMAGSMFAGGKK